MVFQNVQLDYRNFSFGPVGGRIHSIDHVNNLMVVKTYPGGSLVTTYPIDVNIVNEVTQLEYDGLYWWTLSSLGSTGAQGRVINKWKLVSGILQKQVGLGNEINLLNLTGTVHDGNAFCVHRYNTTIQGFTSVGSTQVTIGDTTNLSIGNSIYLGPSSSSSGEIRERTVTGMLGNVVQLNQALDVSFNLGDQAVYRKNIYYFNNRNHITPQGGALIEISSYLGYKVGHYSSAQWKHVTSATSYKGDIYFIRDAQLLKFRPVGLNTGYQMSYHTTNISADNTTVFNAVDIEVDDNNIYKLQTKRRILNGTTFNFEDEESPLNKYEIDSEILANKVTSVTAKRLDNSVIFGNNATGDFVIRVLDQYNNPIFGRSVTVTEDDASGNIPAGYVSFTTNSNGEGNTRYNTGPSPTFRVPTILARDVATALNVKIKVDQVPRAEDYSFITQQGSPINRGFVVQDQLSSNAPLITQSDSTINRAFIDQISIDNLTLIEQQAISKDRDIIQDSISSDTPVEQYGKLEEQTTVIQYEFLFFAAPLPYSLKNPIDTDILVRILGYVGTPLNPSTLVFIVNGVDVSSNVVVTSFGTGLQLYYNPALNFPYSSTVSVYISIQDTATIPRTVSTYYTFDIVSDYRKPILDLVYPPDNSIDNLPNTLIYGIIKDLETGVNLDSIEMYVGGIKVNHITELLDANTVRVLYQTDFDFPYQSNIAVSIYATDYEDNMMIGSWSFYIQQAAGVLFNNVEPRPCSVLVPIGTDICTEVYGLEDGLNLNTIYFNVDGKDVVYFMKPKILVAD